MGGTVSSVGGEQPAGTDSDGEKEERKGERGSRLPDLPTPRHGLGVVAENGRIWVLAGGPVPGLTVSGAVESLRAQCDRWRCAWWALRSWSARSCRSRGRAALAGALCSGRCTSRTRAGRGVPGLAHRSVRWHFDRFGIARGMGPGPAYPIGLATASWCSFLPRRAGSGRCRRCCGSCTRATAGACSCAAAGSMAPASCLRPRRRSRQGTAPARGHERAAVVHACALARLLRLPDRRRGVSRVIVFRATGRLGRAP